MGILKKKKAPPYSKPKTISYKEILFKNSACTNHRFNSIFCCRNLVITLEQMTEIFISLDNFTPQRLAEVETMLSFIPALPKNESSKNELLLLQNKKEVHNVLELPEVVCVK